MMAAAAAGEPAAPTAAEAAAQIVIVLQEAEPAEGETAEVGREAVVRPVRLAEWEEPTILAAARAVRAITPPAGTEHRGEAVAEVVEVPLVMSAATEAPAPNGIRRMGRAAVEEEGQSRLPGEPAASMVVEAEAAVLNHLASPSKMAAKESSC